MTPSPLLQEEAREPKRTFLEESTFTESSSSSSSDNLDTSSNHNQNETQQSPNNKRRCHPCCPKPKSPLQKISCFQKGSKSGAIANLCSATLGAGVLALPYAIKAAGLVLGLLLLLIAAVLTVCSIDWITQAMERTSCKTYEDLTLEICGTKARYLLEVLNFIFCFGTAVAYVVAVGDILDQGVIGLLHNNNNNNDDDSDGSSGQGMNLPSYINREFVMVLFWLIAMYPLSLHSKVDALRYASLVGICSVGYLVLAAVIHSSRYLAEDGSSSLWEEVSLWPDNFWDVIRACPIVMFAFSCQPNVLPIYDELGETDEDEGDADEENLDDTDDYDEEDSEDDNHPSTTLNNSLVDADKQSSYIASSTTRTSSTVSEGATSSSTSTTLENIIEPSASNNNSTLTTSSSSNQRNNNNNKQKQKIKSMACVTRTGVSICLTFYTLMGFFGYANFGPYTQDNILKNYCIHDTKDGMMIAAFVGITLAVVMAFPLNIFPARSTLDGVLRRWEGWACWKMYFGCCFCKSKNSGNGDGCDGDEEQLCVGNSNNSLEEPLLSDTTENASVDNERNSNVNHEEERGPTPSQQKQPSKLRHIILTTLISGSALGVAIAVPDITIVLGLMGGTASSFISFIFPALFARDAFINSKRTIPLEVGTDDNVERSATNGDETRQRNGKNEDEDGMPKSGGLCKILFIWSVIAVGVVVGILSTGVTVYGIFNPDSTPSTCSDSKDGAPHYDVAVPAFMYIN